MGVVSILENLLEILECLDIVMQIKEQVVRSHQRGEFLPKSNPNNLVLLQVAKHVFEPGLHRCH